MRSKILEGLQRPNISPARRQHLQLHLEQLDDFEIDSFAALISPNVPIQHHTFSIEGRTPGLNGQFCFKTSVAQRALSATEETQAWHANFSLPVNIRLTTTPCHGLPVRVGRPSAFSCAAMRSKPIPAARRVLRRSGGECKLRRTALATGLGLSPLFCYMQGQGFM
jgi:hypothetical protein